MRCSCGPLAGAWGAAVVRTLPFLLRPPRLPKNDRNDFITSTVKATHEQSKEESPT